jgi:hypothetical protein
MSRRHQPVSSRPEGAGPPAEAPRDSSAAFHWRAALALLGACSILPPYLGPAIGLDLNVKSSVEVVDHVLPGVLVIVCAGLAALQVRRREAAEDSTLGLMLMGACALAGLWQTVTHAPLVLDAGEPLTPWDSVILHSTPGPLLVALSIWLFLRTPEAERRVHLAP